ncbi:hypothetical protein ETB97_004829 [Aspergillus alliaceus]|uniref:Uncharacterized protein n=1 Tax=Petromyces alliaceus TaxID=209559 RepID=A0A8H6EAB8_PETAA|nr:hypothetical protein ETB97_004829 [Aspergillus burnettii]
MGMSDMYRVNGQHLGSTFPGFKIFNLVKEVYIPKIVEYFQQAKITALIYDVRNYGDSDGLPPVAAAALDKQAKLVIAVCPMTHEPLGKYDTEEDEELRRMLMRCTRDRVAQVKGNPPARVPTMTPSSHSVFGGVHFGAGVYDVMMGLRWTVAPSFDLELTLRSILHQIKWDPMDLVEFFFWIPQ